MKFQRILTLFAAVLPGVTLSAAEWSWTWKPASGDPVPRAEICTFQYGKKWAYAIELDDGPKWARPFAAPFLAGFHYTDAPPGVPGGARRPFVGSVAVIAGVTGNNDSALNWEDLRALREAGWGVINHSYDHRANGWSGPAAQLNDAQAHADAFWSQTIFAAFLPGGRAPTAVAYANGYTDYNRDHALTSRGIAIATLVGGRSPRNVLDLKVDWMNFPRSYLDEPVWTNAWSKSAPMSDFPGGGLQEPAADSFVIDFTHVIEQKPDSPNQQRWRTRLQTIESRWAAGGVDGLWCAPTGEIADYLRAAKAATVKLEPGKLSVTLPDDLPGSAVTFRLSGIGATAAVQAPDGGALYRQGSSIFLTSPRLGLWGAPPPTPRLKRIYDGPAVSVTFSKPAAVAGVTLRVFGNAPSALPYRLAVRTSGGEQVFAERTVGPGWVVGGHLCPIVPSRPAILGTGLTVQAAEPLKAMTVWALDK